MDSLTPADVQAALKAQGLDIQVRTFDTSTATSEQAAESIGTSLGSIVKSIVLMVNGDPIVVLASGDQKIDTRKIATLFGVGRKKVKIAKPDECLTHAGYTPGGVPPLGHRQILPIYIDRTLSRFETVYAAAGSPNSIFPIAYARLVAVTSGMVEDLVIQT